jgi:UDP-N-acetylglucosamine 2-epimerase (non-hydrolysing)/GDP/UDP-N,N'-diacetylbacillosamine 2-epimerase (hydrolysing)
MNLLKQDSEIDFQLVVTGAHLSEQHGSTIKFIEQDGFIADALVDIQLSDDSVLETAHALGRATSQLADAFVKLKPDLVVVLGDRYEILGAAQAALILGIPIAHIHGGEVTTGAFDDSIRHSITKMSNLHFCAAEDYQRRLIQLGESPNTVFNVGALGVDVLLNLEKVTRDELASLIGIELRQELLLVTVHPTTRSEMSMTNEITELLTALDHFAQATIVFTGVNADPGYRYVNDEISKFVLREPKRRVTHNSLGQKNYLNLMRVADVVIGNSSSGIIEAPALHVPTVNIGSRQDGRLRADSIIDCKFSQNEIRTAIETALSPSWKTRCLVATSKYGSGNTANSIADTLKNTKLTTQKIFFDNI